MAFNNRRSWRLKFIDIDNSFVLSTNESQINGYIVARAPKGTQRATYFPQGSAQAIDALMGVGSAHWPDLLEAKSFNAEYPLYISAPPGTSNAYPSELGGFYVTKNGIYKFYGITDKQELAENVGNAFKVKVQPGREQYFDSSFVGSRKTQIVIQSPELEDYEPVLDEPGAGIFKLKKGPALLSIQKDRRLQVTDLDYDMMKNGQVSPVGTIKTFWGDNSLPVNERLWTFNGNLATMNDFGMKYEGDDERNPLKDFIGETNYDYFFPEGPDSVDINKEGFMKLMVDGFYQSEDEDDNRTFYIPFGIQDNLSYLVTLRNDTYAYFMQKGCTEVPTSIKLSMIGYDKYRYDSIFAFAAYDTAIFKANDTKGKIRIVADDLDAADQAALNKAMEDNEYVAFFDPVRPGKIEMIGQYVDGEDSDDAAPYYKDVTGNFTTRYFTCQTLLGKGEKEVYHKIFYVESASSINHVLTEEENVALYGQDGLDAYVKGIAQGKSAPKNIWFNAMTISCSEQVYVGRTTSGGEFTGSLDERGTDSFGGGIFFPEILQDDDVSFIEVRVLKKFGDDQEDLDETGFWTHKRIVDPFDISGTGSSISERNFTIEGDRYCTLVMTMNLLEQKTGGIWRQEYFQIIKDGIMEGMLPEYDDVMIYMEPTGQEFYKTDLADLSRSNELAAVISPKILTPNSRGVFTNQMAERVIVNGRVSTLCNAQYAGEFEFYDAITFKKYWCQPIGDVGCNLMRIIEKKYGGWAPAWTNIAGDLGGQLKRSVIRSRYQFEDEATKTLDTKGINPIVFTSDEGLMIVSQKTTQDPNFISDWSYLGHALSFILVKREIRDNVMRPQIMKPINEYWMSLRQTQVENILSKRTGGASPIWAVAECDILGQNNAMTKAARNFVIKVNIKVYTFSETVTLVIEYMPQSA